MTDVEKIKIEVLRDALVDASATIRALEAKIRFLVSYNAVFLGVISTIFINYKSISLIPKSELFYISLTSITLVWIVVFVLILFSVSPKINPTEVFKNDKDCKDLNDMFFVFTNGERNFLDLDVLIRNYNKIDSFDKIQQLLYKEIGVVSYIRDLKSKNVNIIIQRSWMLTLAFLIVMFSFGINALLVHHIG